MTYFIVLALGFFGGAFATLDLAALIGIADERGAP